MARVRELMLLRAKEPAKLWPLRKGGKVPEEHEPEPAAKEMAVQCNGSMLQPLQELAPTSAVSEKTPARQRNAGTQQVGLAERRHVSAGRGGTGTAAGSCPQQQHDGIQQSGADVVTPVAVRRAAPSKVSEHRRPRSGSGGGSCIAIGVTVGNANAADKVQLRPSRHGSVPSSAMATRAVMPADQTSLGSAALGDTMLQAKPTSAVQAVSDPKPEAAAAPPPRRFRMPAAADDSSAAPATRQLGKVPLYLVRRKEEAAKAKRRAALPAEPVPPPGYRRVDEEERRSTVSSLKTQRDEVQQGLRKLPFKIETLGQKQRERDLDCRLAQLDRLLGMFEKPVVFVPADSDPICARGG
eukprot:TRINITY_DN23940_c0_g1_i1.p1 TRINITY_DN23940_c0_g1~~TRINITY_DN23940_c0_g1_i1.p1  ORF type:complete len:354 (+),score=73.69 TRINITY_DN23940_c0_g1_i1:263-1324(+)